MVGRRISPASANRKPSARQITPAATTSVAGAAARTTDATVEGLEENTLADGIFHVASLAVLAVPSVGLVLYETSYDQVGQLPEESDSVKGFEALSGSFGPGQVQPIIVLARARRTVWTDEAFEAIDLMTQHGLTLELIQPGFTNQKTGQTLQADAAFFRNGP